MGQERITIAKTLFGETATQVYLERLKDTHKEASPADTNPQST